MICGIDCGLGGAVAFLSADGACSVHDMPVFEIRSGKAVRHELDGRALLRLLTARHIAHAIVEQQQAMPRQGVASSFKTGAGYGTVLGVLIGASIPYTLVRPNVWKKALGVPAAKDGARARASQLLPQAAHLWPLRKHDGRAESALLALYGARQLAARSAA